MKLGFTGRLFDIGNMEEGRGLRLKIGEKIITIIGLDEHELRRFAPSFGTFVALTLESDDSAS